MLFTCNVIIELLLPLLNVFQNNFIQESSLKNELTMQDGKRISKVFVREDDQIFGL